MTQVLSLRVDDELAGWVAEYARQRRVTRQALITEALRSFRDDCESGVPEIRSERAEKVPGRSSSVPVRAAAAESLSERELLARRTAVLRGERRG